MDGWMGNNYQVRGSLHLFSGSGLKNINSNKTSSERSSYILRHHPATVWKLPFGALLRLGKSKKNRSWCIFWHFSWQWLPGDRNLDCKQSRVNYHHSLLFYSQDLRFSRPSIATQSYLARWWRITIGMYNHTGSHDNRVTAKTPSLTHTAGCC